MPAKRLTTTVHLSPAEWERVQRLDALCVRALDIIGDAGEIDYPKALQIIRSLADEVRT
jgi:hypothetical protein